MSAARSGRRTQGRLAPLDGARAFRLVLHPEREIYGVSLDETYGPTRQGLTSPVVRTSGRQTGRVIDAVLAAVRVSGHPASVLAFDRAEPIIVNEAAGVRLALILLTTQPVTRHDRVRAIVAGIHAMSIEETYYWYAKCIGLDAPKARKALRVLLADE